ncbi:MAG: hypothetical protein JXA96_02610, partial [Sedimentisphaerales bacterium]|nr:hypothetical protein [Sedimentisphaerales bacterium]
MKKLILTLLLTCSISVISRGQATSQSSAISRRQATSQSVDGLQGRLFYVSTLKGVKEVYSQVQIEVMQAVPTQLRSVPKIGTIESEDIREQVVQALQKADIPVASQLDNTSENAPLSLNISIFIKLVPGDPPIYNTYISTEALQSIKLGRDDSIRSFSRTWPMQPTGLSTR